MRTTKRELDGLMRIASKALQCKRHEVFTRLKAIEDAFNPTFRAAGYSGVTITPYRDATWMLFASAPALDRDGQPIPGAARHCCLPFDFQDFANDPTQIIAEFCELCA